MRLLLILLPLGILLHIVGKGDSTKTHVLSKEAQNEIVDTLNKFRRNVSPTASNMLKVVWDEKAFNSARKWAQECKFKSSDILKSRKMEGGIYCGESISASNFVRSWSEVIEEWSKTKSYFKYGVGATDPSKKRNPYGYTQVIWYKSYQVGCSLAYCPTAQKPFYYVCHFCPSGNINEQIATPYKKGPSCGDCPNNCEDKLCTNPCKHENMLSDCQKITEMLGCTHELIQKRCKASCNCKTEII